MGSSDSRVPTAASGAAVGAANTEKKVSPNGVGNTRLAPDLNSANSDRNQKLYQASLSILTVASVKWSVKLVDMHGGGELIKWMRYARKGGDYSIVDGYFETTIKNAMYNGGKGKLESVAVLVKARNKERNEKLGAFSRKKGKGKSGPNILDDFNQENNQGDLKKALKLLDGGKSGKGDAKYRDIVWKVDERGSMGENLVGCCLMQGSPLHNELAIRLLNEYPKLINDIFLSEDYYGFTIIYCHQNLLSIVSQDPSLTNYLLQHGADIKQRCYGAFFCPDDQKGSRTDSLEHEYVELSLKTDYTGRMYYGEYPLAFAELIQSAGYQWQHCAPHDGGKLQIMNKQNLTPLTLAAKLAKRMYGITVNA
uniref:Uncharacterized protein n=1 Tax=Ditylenchus dipsaci TaxID=166011 RepID=A0A915EQ02_9BILA